MKHDFCYDVPAAGRTLHGMAAVSPQSGDAVHSNEVLQPRQSKVASCEVEDGWFHAPPPEDGTSDALRLDPLVPRE